MIYERERTYSNRPNISWGAVFGGWIFAYAFALLLYLAGAAAGLTTMSALNKFSMGVTIGTGIWMGVAWIVATWCGAYFAGRLCGRTDKGTGALHGMIVWGLSGVMTLLMASLQIGAAASAGANAVQGIAKAGASAAQGAGQLSGQAGQAAQNAQSNGITSQITQQIRSQVRQNVGQAAQNAGVNPNNLDQAIQQLDDQTLGSVASALLAGNTQQAKQTLSQRTSLSDADLDRLTTSINDSARQYGNEVKNKAGAAAEQTGDYASGALWAAFIASLIGLGAGAWGGSAGARRSARIYGETVVEADVPRTDVPRTDVPPYGEQRRAV